MAQQKVKLDDSGGFRTEPVEGAVITSMGIIEGEKGPRFFMETDDEKGLVTWRAYEKGAPVGHPDDNTGEYIISTRTPVGAIMRELNCFSKDGFVRSTEKLDNLGIESLINWEAKTWDTDPKIVGQKIWIERVKTGIYEGKEMYEFTNVTQIGENEQTAPKQEVPKAPAKGKPNQPAAPAKGTLTPELTTAWKEALGKVLAEPLNEIGINGAIKKLYPDEATGKNAAYRKSLADVRSKALAALVKDGTLEMDENGKYTIAA